MLRENLVNEVKSMVRTGLKIILNPCIRLIFYFLDKLILFDNFIISFFTHLCREIKEINKLK